MTVAVVVGRAGIDTLLIISQVILSIVLPFVMFPLVWLTSSSLVMRVRKPKQPNRKKGKAKHVVLDEKCEGASKNNVDIETLQQMEKVMAVECESPVEEDVAEVLGIQEIEVSAKGKDKESVKLDVGVEIISPPVPEEEENNESENTDEYVDYSNSWTLSILGYLIWVIVVVANSYLIVTLAID